MIKSPMDLAIPEESPVRCRPLGSRPLRHSRARCKEMVRAYSPRSSVIYLMSRTSCAFEDFGGTSFMEGLMCDGGSFVKVSTSNQKVLRLILSTRSVRRKAHQAVSIKYCHRNDDNGP
ncbi:hypothetical protein EVAR_61846_1 [Eumeta japonica]|uniref:Uncharacterized protein n=1 Tax=Eumeta variegata TaxID=151549 RepID=A0A4C2A0W1_EUMVA|nr:hypothetical protein EVAR_61846_1 [Eumeta japonica]